MRNNSLRRRFDIFTLGSAGAITIIATSILLFERHTVFTAILVGICWAGVAHGLAWGLAEVVAPGWVLEWRHRLISGNEGWRKPVGQYFSVRFGALGQEPWKSPIARSRLRSVGILLAGFSGVVAAALLLIPGLLDQLFSTLLNLR
jgi:hypothetical protein